jgi:hypothetical protein
MSYENEPTQWEIEDSKADAEYDTKKDKCAHFTDDVWDKVSTMPTAYAVMYGEQLMKIANQTIFNKSTVADIWGKDLGKSSKLFDV